MDVVMGFPRAAAESPGQFAAPTAGLLGPAMTTTRTMAVLEGEESESV